jgi:hypothetical protein
MISSEGTLTASLMALAGSEAATMVTRADLQLTASLPAISLIAGPAGRSQLREHRSASGEPAGSLRSCAKPFDGEHLRLPSYRLAAGSGPPTIECHCRHRRDRPSPRFVAGDRCSPVTGRHGRRPASLLWANNRLKTAATVFDSAVSGIQRAKTARATAAAPPAARKAALYPK